MAMEILLLIVRALVELAVLALGTAFGIELYFRLFASAHSGAGLPVVTTN